MRCVAGRDGITALDFGQGLRGDRYAFLDQVLRELVAGQTRHGGQLLGALGVRFLVAEEGDAPPAVMRRLDAQVDLFRVPAGVLVIYRNPRQLPVASVVQGEGFAEAATTTTSRRSARLPDLEVSALEGSDGGDAGTALPAGTAYVAEQFVGGWRARSGGTVAEPREAAGWGMTFATGSGRVQGCGTTTTCSAASRSWCSGSCGSRPCGSREAGGDEGSRTVPRRARGGRRGGAAAAVCGRGGWRPSPRVETGSRRANRCVVLPARRRLEGLGRSN